MLTLDEFHAMLATYDNSCEMASIQLKHLICALATSKFINLNNELNWLIPIFFPLRKLLFKMKMVQESALTRNIFVQAKM